MFLRRVHTSKKKQPVVEDIRYHVPMEPKILSLFVFEVDNECEVIKTKH